MNLFIRWNEIKWNDWASRVYWGRAKERWLNVKFSFWIGENEQKKKKSLISIKKVSYFFYTFLNFQSFVGNDCESKSFFRHFHQIFSLRLRRLKCFLLFGWRKSDKKKGECKYSSAIITFPTFFFSCPKKRKKKQKKYRDWSKSRTESNAEAIHARDETRKMKSNCESMLNGKNERLL